MKCLREVVTSSWCGSESKNLYAGKLHVSYTVPRNVDQEFENVINKKKTYFSWEKINEICRNLNIRDNARIISIQNSQNSRQTKIWRHVFYTNQFRIEHFSTEATIAEPILRFRSAPDTLYFAIQINFLHMSYTLSYI